MMSRLMQTIALVLLGLAILIVVGSVRLGEIAAHPMRLRTSHAKRFELHASENPLARVEDVELTASDAMLLRGTFAVPEKQNGGAVILLHSISDNRIVVSGFARLFLANGYRVLLVDSRAQGTSGGAFATYGVLEQDDVHRWLDCLETENCIYGLGRVDGGGKSLVVSGERKPILPGCSCICVFNVL